MVELWSMFIGLWMLMVGVVEVFLFFGWIVGIVFVFCVGVLVFY